MEADVGGSPEGIQKALESEYADLQDTAEGLQNRIEALGVAEIVRLYYKVMSTSSMIRALKALSSHSSESIREENAEKERWIQETFNQRIHPSILAHLEESVRRQTAELKGLKSQRQERTKEAIEDKAEPYDRLRRAMSTKEFVVQYDAEQRQ